MDKEKKVVEVAEKTAELVKTQGGKAMSKLDKVKGLASNVGRKINKHSPTILTTAGVVGLGATAYFSYKSRDQVEAVVEKIEDQRANDIEPNKMEIARDLTQALALPISTGLLSVGLIFTSHQIQRNRIRVLAGVVASSAAENLYYRSKYRDEYGEDAYNDFYTTKEEEVQFTNEKGEEETKVAKVKDDISNGLNGMWFDKSEEYAQDDNAYNKTYVQSVIEKLELIYFQRGFLLMNEALQEFGFEPTRQGAILGWSQSQISPNFEVIQHKIFNEDTGFEEPQLYVRWNMPASEYDTFDYSEGLDKWR